MPSPAMLATERAMLPPGAPTPGSGGCVAGPPRPCRAAAAPTPGNAQAAAAPAGHNTSATRERGGLPTPLAPAPADTAPAGPAGPAHRGLSSAPPVTPAATRAAATAAERLRLRASAVYAALGPGHPEPDCRRSGR